MDRRPGAAAAGRQARCALERMLGFPGEEETAGWRVGWAQAAPPQRVRVRLMKGARGLDFQLAPAGTGKVFRRLPAMTMLRDGPGPDQEEARVLRAVARRLAGRSLAEVLAVFRPAGGAADRSQRDGRWLKHLRADAASWRTFLVPDMTSPHADGMCESRSILFVRHDDLECRRMARLGDPLAALYNQRQSFGEKASTCGISDFAGARVLYSDLRDGDVVHGPNRRLESILRGALPAAGGRPSLTVISGGCTEEVVGDEVGLAARRCAGDRPLLHLPAVENGVGGVLRRLLDPGRPGLRSRRAEAVDFLGYPGTPGFRELTGFLADLGIRTNASVWPGFDDASLRNFGRARVLVGMRGARTPGGTPLPRLCGHAEIRILHAPYGVSRTRAWLKEVAALFGKERACESLWLRRARAWRDGWMALREQCRRHALAFVADQAGAAALLSADGWDGFSPLPALREMGFRVLLFEYAGGGRAGRAAAGVERRTFSSRVELRGLLAAERVSAVYSDVTRDSRVVREGKAQFSSRDADMGVSGARLWAWSILSACRTGFFRAYRDSLEAA